MHTSMIDENTDARGVLAPASKFAALRLNEPAEVYDEKKLPTRFEIPCPMNS
jgi:hypothetical protein